jgi:chromosome segregation ATPase
MTMMLKLLVCVALAVASAEKVTPVQKVIQLLQDMINKGQAAIDAEQVQFSTYSSWCTNTNGEKRRAIKKANEAMEMNQADIQKYSADAAKLGEEIAELDETIATIIGDTKAAMKVRDMEHADFLMAQNDYQQSVDSLASGIDTVKAQNADVSGFVQLAKEFAAHPAVEAKTKAKIMKYLNEDPEDVDANAISMLQGPGTAKAFGAHLGPIIQMFEEMKDKFEGKVADTEKHETEDNHEFMMLKQDLDNQKATAESARDMKAQLKAEALQNAADSKGALADVTGTRDADTAYLQDTDATCTAKASAFEDRQKLRGEEIEALEKAIEILGGTPSAEHEKHLPQFTQVKSKSLVQLRSRVQNPNQVRVAAYLQEQGKQLHSKVLSVIALRVAADPFKTVKKMIKDMIVKLMEEATEEAEHKGFCDNELATNEHTRKEKTEQVDILHAEIDELEASIASLTSELSDLAAAVAQLDAAMAEATSIRNAEQAKNAQTIKDAKAGAAATEQALKVLNDFYAKAAEATSLTQQKTKTLAKQPEIFDDTPYTGMGADSGGVVGMIEVIIADFQRLESDTTAAEEESQREQQELANDTEVDKTSKNGDIQHKTAKKEEQNQALINKKADLDGTQKELDSAMKYYEKLKPQCIETGESYEDKVAARKEEIESLQEALKILNGEDLA